MIKISFEENKSVAYDEDKQIGECNFIEKENTWNIVHTEVDEAYQGQGIARKLVECVIENAKKFSENLSVIKEGKIAAEAGAHAMHDVTEGGILGACWEVADCAGLGVEVYCDSIPVKEETRIICSELGVDHLRLISSGSMLIVCEKGEEMVRALKDEGINAAVIGKITEKGRYVVRNGGRYELEEPGADELYRVRS